MTDLSTVSTKELCDELCKRDAVVQFITSSENSYSITEFVQKKRYPNTRLYAVGAARILVVTD